MGYRSWNYVLVGTVADPARPAWNQVPRPARLVEVEMLVA